MPADVLRRFRRLVADQHELKVREAKLLGALRQVLAKIGYRFEPIAGNGAGSLKRPPGARQPAASLRARKGH